MPRSLIAVLLLASLAAFASDLKVSRKIKDATGVHPAGTYYFQGQRIRFDHRDSFGYDWKDGRAQTVAYGPRLGTIYQCDMHRVLELDFDHHQYTATELDRDGAPIDPKPGLPAEHSSGAHVKVIIETRDTGETRQIFGRTAHHYIITRREIPDAGACASPQQSTEDGWYIDLDPRATSCFELEHPAPHAANAVLTVGGCRDDYDFERTGPTPPPFAVDRKITTRIDARGKSDTQEMVDTVTELSSLPLDPQIFDLPTGYKRVDKLDDSPNLPWLLRGRLMWQSVKSTVWGWTPWGK